MRIVDAQIHTWGAGLPSNLSHRQVTHFTPAEAIALMDVIRALTRLSSVVCLTVLVYPRRRPIPADRHFTAKKSTAWPIPGRGEECGE